MSYVSYPEWRVVPDCRADGVDPRAQSGFYTRQPNATAARVRYREVYPRMTGRLIVERWKEPLVEVVAVRLLSNPSTQ